MSRWHWIALVIVTLASLVAQLAAELHYAWERIPGFYALYGFVGCIAIIFVSKWLGKLFIQRREDYYDRD